MPARQKMRAISGSDALCAHDARRACLRSTESVRPTQWLAEHQQMTESALLKQLIELSVQRVSHADGDVLRSPGRRLRAARLYVRLHPEDQLLLMERAAARQMPAATYVSVLVRAHLRDLAPLPKAELMALKRSVAELGAIGRNLNQLTRLAHHQPGHGGSAMGTFHLDRSGAIWDLTSYARRGPGQRDRLSPAEVALIARTVRHTPEVMVKVTGGGGANTSHGVNAHFDYIGRRGDLEIETDDGERLSGRGVGRHLIHDWDLDLDEDRERPDLFATNRRASPKLVHKLIFSMPAGTPPKKVLAAVRDFAREEFGLQHRYAMVLHTDEPHPHVHVVVKAVSEAGVRLNIHKATLRHWRQEFARHLREHGVEANATERSVRGQSRAPKLDSIFRAAQRGESSHIAARVREVARELKAGLLDGSGAAPLKQTRREVVSGWSAIRDRLLVDGQHQLAEEVRRFVNQMPPPRTEKAWLAQALIELSRQGRSKDRPPVR